MTTFETKEALQRIKRDLNEEADLAAESQVNTDGNVKTQRRITQHKGGAKMEGEIGFMGLKTKAYAETGYERSKDNQTHFSQARKTQHENQKRKSKSQESLKHYEESHQQIYQQKEKSERARLSAQLLEQEYEDLLYATAVGGWSVGTYLLADKKSTLSTAGHLLVGSWSGSESIKRPIRFASFQSSPSHLISDNQTLSIAKHRLRHLNPLLFSDPRLRVSFQTLMHSRELSVISSFPHKSVPGIEVHQSYQFGQWFPPIECDDSSFTLGNLVSYNEPLSKRKVELNLDDLVMHGVVLGSTGSGKSHTTRRLLNAVWSTLKVPFLIIDPKQEYYRKLKKSIPNLQIIHLQEGTLSLNPFAVPVGRTIVGYAEQLRDVFCSSFDTEAAMPEILFQSILQAYEKRQWSLNNPVSQEEYQTRPFPTMTDLINQIPSILQANQYQGRLLNNYRAALQSRLKSFTLGWKGWVFNRPVNPQFNLQHLLSCPTVINTDALDSTSRSFLISLLILQLNYLRRAEKESRYLKHVLILEEAHQLLRNPSSLGRMSEGRLHSMESILESIAELRAFGQGLLIVEQSPSELHPAVLRGANLRLIHRLLEGNEQKVASELLGIPIEHSWRIGQLERGFCLARAAGWPYVVLTRVNKSVTEDL